jgi:ribose transport system ATP-binding protein
VSRNSRDSVVSALQVDHLSKTFGGQRALCDVSLRIEPGEVRALLGHNGSGKSTLIKILSGFHEPDAGGDVRVAGRALDFGAPKHAHQLGCRFVHQDLGLSSSLSVADNIALAGGFPTRAGTIRRSVLAERTRISLAALGVSIDPRTPVRELSPALQTAVAIARALGPEDADLPSLLVLDEPSATMTGDDVETLFRVVRRIAERHVGTLYVTHRLDEVFRVADSVSVLRDGRLIESPPLDQLDRAGLTELMVGSRLQQREEELSDAVAGPSEQSLLQVAELSAGNLDRFSLRVRAGEIVGIGGSEGSGRESLLPAVFGGIPRDGGTIRLQDAILNGSPKESVRVGMVFLPADRRRHGGFFSLSARENIAMGSPSAFRRRGFLRRSIQRQVARDWFERLQVHPVDNVDMELGKYSGGNQQKILLAKWLRLEPKVLLVEEPTHGVDVAAKVDLHAAIVRAANTGAAVVVSSSDVEELVTLCSRVIVLADGRISRVVSGPDLTPSTLSHELLHAGAGGDA